jgi:putative FmdB family regulatory protein
MPLYEYQCTDCGTRFDALVRMTAASDSVSCDHCTGQNVRRMVSTFAMVGGKDDPTVMSGPVANSGGCCGGSCGCGR